MRQLKIHFETRLFSEEQLKWQRRRAAVLNSRASSGWEDRSQGSGGAARTATSDTDARIRHRSLGGDWIQQVQRIPKLTASARSASASDDTQSQPLLSTSPCAVHALAYLNAISLFAANPGEIVDSPFVWAVQSECSEVYVTGY